MGYIGIVEKKMETANLVPRFEESRSYHRIHSQNDSSCRGSPKRDMYL